MRHGSVATLLVALALGVIPSASARTLAYMGPEPQPSIFGIDTSIYDSNHAYFVRDVPSARSLGARWDRYTIGPATGSGNFNVLDYEVKQARSNGLGVVLSFGGIARACSRPTRNVHACAPTSAADLRAYKRYVRDVVLHYRNVVSYYESWAEPNSPASWLGGADPAAYAKVLKAQYAVFQSVNSKFGLHLELLFGSPHSFATIPGTGLAVLPFTSQVLAQLHGQRAFDGVALHAYRFPPGPYGPATPACDYVAGLRVEVGYATSNCPSPSWRWLTWPQELQAYEQVFQDYGYGQPPLWLTEFGWPGNAVDGGVYFPDDLTQSLDLTAAYADLLQLPFVQGALWFNVRDYQPGIGSGDPSFFYHYGLLDYTFGAKPAAVAFQTLARANPGR